MKYWVTYQKYGDYWDADREEITGRIVDIKGEVTPEAVRKTLLKDMPKNTKIAIIVAWSRIENIE